jgi:hypothetical protein
MSVFAYTVYNRTSVPAMLEASGNVAHIWIGDARMSILSPKKKCLDCGETDLSKFGTNNAYKDGLMPRCRKCNNAHARQYYAAHSERPKAYSRTQFLANPEYYLKKTFKQLNFFRKIN